LAEVGKLKRELTRKDEDLAKTTKSFKQDVVQSYLVGFKAAVEQASTLHPTLDFLEFNPGKSLLTTNNFPMHGWISSSEVGVSFSLEDEKECSLGEIARDIFKTLKTLNIFTPNFFRRIFIFIFIFVFLFAFIPVFLTWSTFFTKSICCPLNTLSLYKMM